MAFTLSTRFKKSRTAGPINAARFLLAILATCAVGLTNCAADLQSPRYRIHYAGFKGDDSRIDTAWEIACKAVYFNANRGRSEWIVVQFEPRVEWQGREYAGLTTETFTRVRWNGECVTGPESALIHELVHVALYLRDGDADSAHSHHDWHEIDSLRVDCK